MVRKVGGWKRSDERRVAEKDRRRLMRSESKGMGLDVAERKMCSKSVAGKAVSLSQSDALVMGIPTYL